MFISKGEADTHLFIELFRDLLQAAQVVPVFLLQFIFSLHLIIELLLQTVKFLLKLRGEQHKNGLS